MEKIIKYSCNNADYKIEESENGRYLIYERSKLSGKYTALAETETLEKAKDYCCFREPAPYFLQKLM